MYRTKTPKATAVRAVDAHSLAHRNGSKAKHAVDAADCLDGFTVLQNPTQRLVAAAFDVSVGSIARARRLTPAQREAVRRGDRPLVMPRT